MRKVVIFTEGQSEQIFIRNLLLRVIDCSRISFKCLRLYAGNAVPVPFDFSNPHAEVSFLIINVGQDEKVLSVIKEREKDLIRKDFEKIIGLRDMYSEEYQKRSPNNIDNSVTQSFIDGWNSTIQNMSDPSKIKLHIAVMELEAWFLGMYNIFERINADLSIDYIREKLGFDLRSVDPQKQFFHPTVNLIQILDLVNLKYDKSKDVVEKICSQITPDDFNEAFENGRCSSFRGFYREILGNG